MFRRLLRYVLLVGLPLIPWALGAGRAAACGHRHQQHRRGLYTNATAQQVGFGSNTVSATVVTGSTPPDGRDAELSEQLQHPRGGAGA